MKGIVTVVISMSYRNFRRYKRREKLLSFSITRKSDLAEIISVSIPILATEKKKKKKTDEGPNVSRLVPRKNFYATNRKDEEKERRQRLPASSVHFRARSMINDDSRSRKLLALPYLETSNYYPGRNTRRRFN